MCSELFDAALTRTAINMKKCIRERKNLH